MLNVRRVRIDGVRLMAVLPRNVVIIDRDLSYCGKKPPRDRECGHSERHE